MPIEEEPEVDAAEELNEDEQSPDEAKPAKVYKQRQADQHDNKDMDPYFNVEIPDAEELEEEHTRLRYLEEELSEMKQEYLAETKAMRDEYT